MNIFWTHETGCTPLLISFLVSLLTNVQSHEHSKRDLAQTRSAAAPLSIHPSPGRRGRTSGRFCCGRSGRDRAGGPPRAGPGRRGRGKPGAPPPQAAPPPPLPPPSKLQPPPLLLCSRTTKRARTRLSTLCSNCTLFSHSISKLSTRETARKVFSKDTVHLVYFCRRTKELACISKIFFRNSHHVTFLLFPLQNRSNKTLLQKPLELSDGCTKTMWKVMGRHTTAVTNPEISVERFPLFFLRDKCFSSVILEPRIHLLVRIRNNFKPAPLKAAKNSISSSPSRSH